MKASAARSAGFCVSARIAAEQIWPGFKYAPDRDGRSGVLTGTLRNLDDLLVWIAPR